MRLGALAQAGASTAGGGKAELAVSEIKAYALREPVSRRALTRPNKMARIPCDLPPLETTEKIKKSQEYCGRLYSFLLCP